jgi:hypothetical protein
MRARVTNVMIAAVLTAMLMAVSGCAGMLTSNATPGAAPQITAQPQDQFVVAGATANFSVGATSSAPMTYQWQNNGSPISGANAATYTTPPVSTSDNNSMFQVVVSNAAGSVTSAAGMLMVTTDPVAPTVTSQPASATVMVGQTASFSVAVSGTQPMTYQWQKNGAAIGGAVAATYTTPATTSADNGSTFVAVVTNSAGSASSNPATLTVNADPVAPGIVTQPSNQSVLAGQTATFSVAASGTQPFTYQWQKNGAAISGAVSSSYTTPAATSADNGSTFLVVVTNSAGSISSAPATLTVNPDPVAPTITTQPASGSVTAGQTATFTVAASGTAPLSYQWLKNGAAISGANSASYTTPATTTNDNGSTFQVIVSNPVGSTPSATATLIVTAAPVAPGITAQPVSQTVTAGQTATFSVAASGTAPLSYQWQKNGGAIGGATASSYTTPATTTNDSGAAFQVVVTNTAGSITSNAAILTVNAAAVAPTFTSQPANVTVTAGQTATFTVATTGTQPFTYQWQKNGAAISGATASSYTTPATTTADNGSKFAAVVTNSAGSVTSSAATLTVNAAPVAPSITTQPASTTVTAGQTATFTVAAGGTAPLTYQWQKNGAAISGATATTYTTPVTTIADSGSKFLVVVTNSTGSATSSAATLTVNAAPVAPSITTQPASATVTAGQTATFTVAAGGTAPLTYQWQKNGAAINGATATAYTTPATTTSDSGSKFLVVVTNSAGSATSIAATLTVNPAATAPSITTQPASKSVTAGQTATFTVAASGTAPLTYQWQKNGTAVSGGTSSSYTTPVTTIADNGSTFVAVVTNSAGNATSTTATLTVTADTTPPTVSISSPASGATVSGTLQVTASASDNVAVKNVQLKVDGANSGAADTSSPYNFSLDTTALSDGAHSLTAVATDTSGNQATSAAVSITVSNDVSAQVTFANNGVGCPINTVAGGPTDPVNSYTCPLPNPTGAGNLMVIFVRFVNSNSPTVTFTDNIGGNTYAQAASCTDTSNNNTQARIFYLANAKAGVNQLTVNFSASSTRVQMAAYEFYNVASSAVLDSATCQVGSGSTISTGMLTPSASGDLVVQFAHADNSASIGSCAVGSQSNINWTMRSSLIASNEPMCGQYGTYNSTASFDPAMSFNTAVDYISLAAAFKAGTAGTPPPSGIRVAYVQHDDGGQEQNTSFNIELPVSGNLVAELTTAGCQSNTTSSCAFATGMSDGTNSWAQIGSTFVSSTGSSQEAVGSIWYAKNAKAGLYPLSISTHGRPGSSFPLSYIEYDIVGASTNPLDTGFGGSGNGLVAISVNQQTGTGGPITSFTAAPSAQNEVILAQIGTEWDTYTGLTSPAGSQFLSAHYNAETNFSWCDLNGGWGLLYNGGSTAAQTWIWAHDASQSAGAGRGVALGVAFQPAP